MKTLSPGMQTHVAGTVTTLAVCWRLTRTDGVAVHLTAHDVDLVVDLEDGTGAQTYRASSAFDRTAIRNTDTYAVDNLNVVGAFDSADIDEDDVLRGLFDFATVDVFLVNWENLADGIIRLRRGRLGEVTLTSQGAFQAELRGLMQAFSRRIGQQYQPTCRADLGSAFVATNPAATGCKVPIEPDLVARNTAYEVGDFVRVDTLGGANGDSRDFQDRIYECTTEGITAAVEPTYDITPGQTTTDGTAVFVARQSWTRAVVVTAVGADPRKEFTVTELTPNSGFTSGAGPYPETVGFADDFMNGGAVIWETGNNAGRGMEIRDFVADDGVTITQDLELFLDLPFDVQVGDVARAYPGCDKRLETCRDRFNNIINFRGEPFVPGNDAVLDYPDAKSG